MNWNSNWSPPPGTVPGDATYKASWPEGPTANPWDTLNQDQLLMLWDSKKKALSDAKEAEMELRKYIVTRAFPSPKEGVNTIELGNNYELKANIKFNYKLADNKIVENCLDRIALMGNMGPFVAERLVSWSPSFLLTEYRNLQEQAKDGDKFAASVLTIVNEMLEITDASPSLEIKTPKAKK
jgi:hypothetical protein